MNTTVVSEMKIELRSSMTINSHHMKVTYEIKNLSEEEIYLLDGLFRVDGSPKLDVSLVYTILEDDTLTLFRGLIEIPHGMQVEVAEVPYSRRLSTGGTLKGTIEASLPLRYNQPYGWNAREETRTARKVRLRIGYVSEKDLEQKPSAKIINGKEVYSLNYRQIVDVQHVLETPAQQEIVEIHVMP